MSSNDLHPIETTLDAPFEVDGQSQLLGHVIKFTPQPLSQLLQAPADCSREQVVSVELLTSARDRHGVNENCLIISDQLHCLQQIPQPLIVDFVQPKLLHQLPMTAQRWLTWSSLLDAHAQTGLHLKIYRRSIHRFTITPSMLSLQQHQETELHWTPALLPTIQWV